MTSSTPSPHHGRTLLLGVVLPLVAIGAAVALVASWRTRLPDEVVAHWGPDGPTRTADFAQNLIVLVGFALITLGITATISLAFGQSSVARRTGVGVCASTGTFFAGLIVTVHAIQMDGVSDTASPGLGIGLSTFAALGVGVLTAALAGADPATPARGPLPHGAPTLQLPEGAEATWSGRARIASRWVLVISVLACLIPGVVVGLVSGHWWMLILFIALAALVVTAAEFTVRIDQTGFTATGLLKWPRVHVPIEEIAHAEVVQVRPFTEFGGWGLRTAIDGRSGVVTRAGQGIAITRSADRVFVATVDDAKHGTALLNTLAQAYRSTQ